MPQRFGLKQKGTSEHELPLSPRAAGRCGQHHRHHSGADRLDGPAGPLPVEQDPLYAALPTGIFSAAGDGRGILSGAR